MAVVPWSTLATAQPKGRFEYVFTYVWGRHDSHNHLDGPPLANAMEGEEERYLPFLESGPSPASVEVDNTGLPGAIVLVLPDYDAGIGFMANTTLRFKHSGIRKRIYRRRKSDESGTLDFDSRYYLLDEIEGWRKTYTDDGTKVPDPSFPLRSVQRYESIGVYPNPDKRYEVRMRYVAAPEPLVSAQDVPPIPEDAIDALVYRALAYLYESAGNASMKQQAMADYMDCLTSLQRRHGSVRPTDRARPKRAMGLRRGRRVRRRPVAADTGFSS